MAENELTYKQEKLCLYIVGGESLKNCSDYLGLSEMTVWRYLKLQTVKDRIRELRRMVIENSINDLLQLNKRAVQTLESLLDCDNMPTRCRAAVAILTKSQESIDFFEYESRLRKIEENLSLK